MARVVLDRLTKVYNGADGSQSPAVNELSLTIADGEFLVVVGPSGSGKSTTLRLIAGLEEANSGTITIGDRSMTGVAPKDRDVAMVFQNQALFPHLTARDNIVFGLRLRRLPVVEIERRLKQAVEALSLAACLDRKPAELSGGERQRVALGRAMVRKPDAFLVDEPLSQLDAQLRSQLRTEISLLHRRLGTTMVYVTHDQVEAITLGDRIAVLNDGVLQQIGPPIEVYQRPANLFVAGFFGAPPMNFLTGTMICEVDNLSFRLESSLDTARTASDLSLTVDAHTAEGLKQHHGKRLILGVRPEHIHCSLPSEYTIGLRSPGLDHSPHLRSLTPDSILELVEQRGAESILHLSWSGKALKARREGWISMSVGSIVQTAVDTRAASFFDPDTGAVIQ